MTEQKSNRPDAFVVGVVGAGTMGTGIAQVCLQAGHDVVIHDPDPAAVARARTSIEANLGRLVEMGTLESGSQTAMLAGLRVVRTLEALAAEVDLVIEAAVEDLAVKRSIFRHLDPNALPDVPLATNTGSLSVGEIADVAHHRERVLGLHFFEPVPETGLVEVVAADETSRSIVEAGMSFVTGLGRTPVLCADVPGFIVERVNRAFTLEPLRMLEAGIGDVASIDAAIEGAGYPMGPFRLMDRIGVDTSLALAHTLWLAFQEAPRFRPSPIQEQMVAAGRLGRKAGLGFYRYAADGSILGAEEPLVVDGARLPDVGTGAGRADTDGPASAVERVELAVVNEAYRAVGEEVANAPDVDLALKLGAGHPRGPFERAGEIGLRALVERLRDLQATTAELSGDQYEVAVTLWQMATI